MSACRLMEKCVFFSSSMSEMPSTAEIIKTRYCRGTDSAVCARYLVSEKLGLGNVPTDLLPNQMERIEDILSET